MKQKTKKGPDALHTMLWYLQLLVHTTWSCFSRSVLKRSKATHRQRLRVCNRESGNTGEQKSGGWQIRRFKKTSNSVPEPIGRRFVQETYVLFNLFYPIQIIKITISTQAHNHSCPFIFRNLIYNYRTTNSDKPLSENRLKLFSQKANTSDLLLTGWVCGWVYSITWR